MTVIYKNQLYGLDLCAFLFQNLKKTSPDFEVNLTPLSDSTYISSTKAKIEELEDWSIVRNLNALNQN
jgi:hypothetical protein